MAHQHDCNCSSCRTQAEAFFAGFDKQTLKVKRIEPVCEHGTAMDVHCCNCHGGFLFDSDSCVCEFAERAPEDGQEQTHVCDASCPPTHGIAPCPNQPSVGEPTPRTLQERYNELIYAVERKHPGETRHETALRYIRQAEHGQDNNPPAKASLAPEGGQQET